MKKVYYLNSEGCIHIVWKEEAIKDMFDLS